MPSSRLSDVTSGSHIGYADNKLGAEDSALSYLVGVNGSEQATSIGML